MLSCVWACVPVQRMARDALCAPRLWNAAEPEMIHPRAFCALLQTRRKISRVRLPARRWFGEVLLYFRPLERCAVSVCPTTEHPVLNLMSHNRTPVISISCHTDAHPKRSSLTTRSRGRIELASRAVSARTGYGVRRRGWSRWLGALGLGEACGGRTRHTSRSNHTHDTDTRTYIVNSSTTIAPTTMSIG